MSDAERELLYAVLVATAGALPAQPLRYDTVP
jgi:hypothetical protein